jgi:hypothetical protein
VCRIIREIERGREERRRSDNAIINNKKKMPSPTTKIRKCAPNRKE